MMAVDVSYRSFKVWQRNRDVFLHIWKAEMLWPLLEPVIVLVGLGLGLGRIVELETGQEYIQFVAPGVMAAFPMWSVIAEGGWGSYSRMATQHTYEAMLATPVSLDDVVAGEVLWATTRGVITSIYILIISLALTPSYDLIESPTAVLVLPTALLAGLMFAGMALIATSFVQSVTQLASFVGVVILPMFWMAGVFFPLDQLPEALQVLSWFMPLRHVVELHRAAMTGSFGAHYVVSLVWVCVAGAVFIRIALWSMRRRLIK